MTRFHYGNKVYGISQNPETKDYIIVFRYKENKKDKMKCKKCGEKYTNKNYKWCKPCQLNEFEKNFANWSSGNEVIDSFIQLMQLNIDRFSDTVIEWIPYDQLYNIKQVGKDKLAKWRDGTLIYNKNGYERTPDEIVVLNHLCGPRNIEKV